MMAWYNYKTGEFDYLTTPPVDFSIYGDKPIIAARKVLVGGNTEPIKKIVCPNCGGDHLLMNAMFDEDKEYFMWTCQECYAQFNERDDGLSLDTTAK